MTSCIPLFGSRCPPCRMIVQMCVHWCELCVQVCKCVCMGLCAHVHPACVSMCVHTCECMVCQHTCASMCIGVCTCPSVCVHVCACVLEFAHSQPVMLSTYGYSRALPSLDISHFSASSEPDLCPSPTGDCVCVPRAICNTAWECECLCALMCTYTSVPPCGCVW